MAQWSDGFRRQISRRMSIRSNIRSVYEKMLGITKKKFFVYLQCYFVTIATILGTGVLGLPVTLSQSGLWPFVVSFVIGFLMQALLIVFMADLLQKAVHIQSSSVKYSALEQESFANPSFSGDTPADSGGSSSSSNEDKSNYVDVSSEPRGRTAMSNNVDLDSNEPVVDAASSRQSPAPRERQVHGAHPDLHLLAELFLPRGLRELFDVLLLLQFLALLISYCLAGSEAFAELLHVSLLYTIPVFCWLLSLLVVFAMKFVQPFVSFLTFCKGSMLLVTVALTFGVGASVQRQVRNDFHYAGSSFLMGTVALGGVANVMPYLYEKISASPLQVRRFRWACFLGLATCTVLNIAWCWAVLDIVPQTDADAAAACSAVASKGLANVTVASPASCARNVSLERSRKNGEISTIPLTRIIELDYPSYGWVALLVQLFIVVSITVSFLINGSVLYHTVKGILQAKWPTGRLRCCDRGKRISTLGVTSALVQLGLFAVVFAVSMSNPQSFVKMLEKVASFSLNFEVALFLTVMFWKACNAENSVLPVPVSLPAWFPHLRHLLTIYFAFAVGYDIVISILEAVTDGAAA